MKLDSNIAHWHTIHTIRHIIIKSLRIFKNNCLKLLENSLKPTVEVLLCFSVLKLLLLSSHDIYTRLSSQLNRSGLKSNCHQNMTAG